MRIGPLKLNDEKPVTRPAEKPSKQEQYTLETTRKLTTLDTIGLALLSMSAPVLLANMLTELGNRRDHNKENK